MKSVSIKDYDNSWYRPGGAVKRLLWYFVNVLFFLNPFNPFSGIKVRLLRLFGAQVGVGAYPCSVLDNYRFDNQVKCWKFVIVIST